MGILSDVFGRFFSKNEITYSICLENMAREIYYKELALASAINIVAKMIVNSEIRTFKNKEEIHKTNYYRFNIEPNQNENATEFRTNLIWKLFYENEVLVIKENGRYYIADTFDKSDDVLYQKYFFNVQIKDLTFNKKFYMDEVFYFRLNNSKIKELIDGLYNSYGELISQAFSDYNKSRGVRGKVKLNTTWSQKFEDQQKLQDAIRSKFRSYFSSNNAVLPMEEGFDFTESDKKSVTSSEDVNKMIEGIFDIVAIAFNIPKGIIKGELSEIKEETKNLLTLAVKPVAKLLEDEINRKLYGEFAYSNGSKVKVDIGRVEYISLFDVASSLDVLTRIGFSHNYLLKAIGEEAIDEDWANAHYITKNYQEVQKGGKDGE